jgi:pimeloyl-ACP methyl ester carboxylesterase
LSGNALGQGRSTVQTAAGPLQVREFGSGRPVLLLHGLLVDGHFWDKVVPMLDGFRVVVPDFPLGSHQVPMPADTDLTPPGLARLVTGLIDALGLDDVILAAADTGGAIAQLVAVDHPAKLGGLVLCSCDAFDNFFPPAFKHLQAMGYLPGAIWVSGQFMRLPGVYRQPPAYGLVQKYPVSPELARYWLSPMGSDAGVRRDLGKVLRGISKRYTRDAARRLPGFDKPTTLVWADTNKAFPISDGRKLAELIPKATLVPVPDSYAHVPLDAPQPVADAIIRLR